MPLYLGNNEVLVNIDGVTYIVNSPSPQAIIKNILEEPGTESIGEVSAD